MDKTRVIRNDAFIHLKKKYKMGIRNIFSAHQKKLLQEMKQDESITIVLQITERC